MKNQCSYKAESKTSLHYIFLGLIIAFAAIFRFLHLRERGLEGIEMVYNRPPYSLLFENELVYCYVKPGYLFLLFFIGKIFGYTSDTILFTSAWSGVLAVLVVFFVGKRFHDSQTGLFSAFILAIMPYHVWISRMGMAYSPGILLFAVALLLYSFILTAKKRSTIIQLYALLGLLNGVMFTLHPGFAGCCICLLVFDFFRFAACSEKQSYWSALIYHYLPCWLIFFLLFFLPLSIFEFILRDVSTENSLGSILGINATRDSFLAFGSYYNDILTYAVGGSKIWKKWEYGENLGYDYYIRILMRETGFFNFFLMISGLFFINWSFFKKKLSLEQTIFANILVLAFIYWTFNPRLFFARRNFTPAVIPVALVSGFFLNAIIKIRKVFIPAILLAVFGSVMVAWSYVTVEAKYGHLEDFLNQKKIHEVMIIPGVVYPENPLLANRKVQSLNLELYRKVYSGYTAQEIPNHSMKTKYMVCSMPQLKILGKTFQPTDKYIADLNRFNDELFSYQFKDVFPWKRIGVATKAVAFYLYETEEGSYLFKNIFFITGGEAPWTSLGHVNMAKYFESKGIFEGAVKEYKMALSSERLTSEASIAFDKVQASYGIAQLLFKMGRFRESENYFKGVIEKIYQGNLKNSSLLKRDASSGQSWSSVALQKSLSRLEEISKLKP